MTQKQKEQEEARARLLEWIKPGDTIYTVLRHCSRSGMQRVISLKKIGTDGSIFDLSYNAALACGMRYDRDREGIKIGGCGMDMGFAIVYELSHVLFGAGYTCLGKEGHCPSNYHTNHRDFIHCTGNRVFNPEGPDEGTYCFHAPALGFYTLDEETPCPTCHGKGRLPNPEGPERWDLIHKDGYALLHRWL